ncbi:hypothetical protein H7F37_04090 [Winogradskyella sp. PAMC22761]|nr:hypothetical protein H7F37_04090 [Winogradskyella sp. PAMC22761]
MKTIYYRKNESEYEKGIFISFNVIIGFLILFGGLFYYYLYSIDLPDWTKIGLIAIVAILLMYLFQVQGKKKINLDKNGYGGIMASEYMHTLIKKKKGKVVRGNGNWVSTVGDYEFNSLVVRNKRLLTFYEDCLLELNELTKNGYDEINFRKADNLKRDLNFKIDALKRIAELKIER